METLISAERQWAIWTVLFAAAAFGLWSERMAWGRKLSSAVVTIGLTFALSNLRLIPVAAPAYDAVWEYFVPLAIPLLLLRANLGRIVREAGPTLLAFAAGAAGTVLGTVVAARLVPLGPEGYKLAGIFCATYIGGSLNYVAASEVLELRSGDLLTAGIAADNLVMTLYFLVLFALPSIPRLRRAYVTRHLEDVRETELGAGVDDASSPLRMLDVATAVALAASLCAVGYALAELAGMPSLAILIVTALTVALATAFPRRLSALAGGREIGTLLMMVFFAVIGAGANVAVVLRQGPVLFVFAAVILAVHLAFILLAGRLMGLDLAEIVVASNANMGGPTTAAAMASARRWTALVTPAILCGTLGYAVATFIGTAVGAALR
ncbi:MAG TPA: DUF819 family protein [Candidatus Polarisedimenticolaceae bacterium]|nr:DUF819 family protein [Candidatus Polarisedimenticolaceae bacterium]